MAEDEVYFDCSALVKLILSEEEGAPLAQELAQDSTTLYTSLLTYPEALSALSGARRDGRLSDSGLLDALQSFQVIWPEFYLIDFADSIADRAGELALSYPLSGADAVQIASALAMQQDARLTFVTWDRRQARAASRLGFAVQPPID